MYKLGHLILLISYYLQDYKSRDWALFKWQLVLCTVWMIRTGMTSSFHSIFPHVCVENPSLFACEFSKEACVKGRPYNVYFMIIGN